MTVDSDTEVEKKAHSNMLMEMNRISRSISEWNTRANTKESVAIQIAMLIVPESAQNRPAVTVLQIPHDEHVYDLEAQQP